MLSEIISADVSSTIAHHLEQHVNSCWDVGDQVQERLRKLACRAFMLEAIPWLRPSAHSCLLISLTPGRFVLSMRLLRVCVFGCLAIMSYVFPIGGPPTLDTPSRDSGFRF